MKIEFVAVPVTLDAAAGEDSPRTITGVAVPWDTPAVVSGGQKVQFSRGAFNVDQKAPKLLEGHDMNQLRGVVTELVEAEEGLLFSAKFAKTRASDEAIELIKAGAYDSVSIGAIPTKFKYKGDTMMVSAAEILEISLVSHPAFSDAVITEIAASQPDDESEEEVVEPQPLDIPEEETMSEVTPTVEASAEIVPTAPLFAAARREAKLPTAAEYISAAIIGGDQWREMSEALKAAAPDVTTTDTPGVLPIPIVQPVYNNFRGIRPVVDACGVKAMPGGGKVFIRPEVTTHTSMAAQSAENAALQAGTFVVSSNQVTKGTYGGYVSLSLQDIDWVSDPAILSLILDDMSRIYANTTDDVAADALLAGVTQSAVLTDPTSPSEWVSDIYDAASTILTNSNGNLPTHLFLSPNMYAYLGKLVDTTGRPLFPEIGPMNALGTASASSFAGMAFGLQTVVDRNFASDTVIVGDPSGFEIFEQQKGALSIEAPSTLSRTLSWHGYFATLMIDNTKFVKLT
jgi:HK97 family phage prohead protease